MEADPSVAAAAAAIPWWRTPLGLHAIMAAVGLWPVVRIFSRAGLNRAWAVLLLVPMIGPALVCSALVFQKWPNLPERPKRQRRIPKG